LKNGKGYIVFVRPAFWRDITGFMTSLSGLLGDLLYHFLLLISFGKFLIKPTTVSDQLFMTFISGRRREHNTYTDTEPEFFNVYGAQESIPRKEFRQPM
jgi:hypothetical protein